MINKVRKWNWQKPDWPKFTYESAKLESFEKQWLSDSNFFLGSYGHTFLDARKWFNVESLTQEALCTSEIEGEYLDRQSVRSSFLKNFRLQEGLRAIPPREQGIVDLKLDLYTSYQDPLDHLMLHRWHQKLMNAHRGVHNIGCYRTSENPMQIVSGSFNKQKIHFEAPPSKKIQKEMDAFIRWFNHSAPSGQKPLSSLIRAGITHLYFESIHPFEDGNGRIGRSLSEKALAQSLDVPVILLMAKAIVQNKKAYYQALELASKKNEITSWLCYFSSLILDALKLTQNFLDFFIEKIKFFDRFEKSLNSRQKKCLLRIFEEGPEGFIGGLSVKNYLSITRAKRPTATRDLSDLVSKGALVKTGQLKSTRYYLNIPSFSLGAVKSLANQEKRSSRIKDF